MPILDLANNIIIKNCSKFNFKFNQKSCVTCLSEFVCDESSMKNSIIILECNHVFHFTCKITYIKHKLSDNTTQITCPLCKLPIKKRLICKILSSYKEQLLIIKNSINKNKQNLEVVIKNTNSDDNG
jgi:hypothetical protein